MTMQHSSPHKCTHTLPCKVMIDNIATKTTLISRNYRQNYRSFGQKQVNYLYAMPCLGI